MKLELKHLAPYLPYSVRVNVGEYQEKNIVLTPTILQVYTLEAIKPILHHFSDIKKYIEFNGETINVFNSIYFDCINTYRVERSSIAYLGDLIRKTIATDDFSKLDSVPYWIIQKLLYYHVDIFGLIPKGLAIDINILDK